MISTKTSKILLHSHDMFRYISILERLKNIYKLWQLKGLFDLVLFIQFKNAIFLLHV